MHTTRSEPASFYVSSHLTVGSVALNQPRYQLLLDHTLLSTTQSEECRTTVDLFQGWSMSRVGHEFLHLQVPGSIAFAGL